MYKYSRIKEKLISEFESSSSFRLPSERELCKKYKISRNTAKKALNSLCDDQLVTRKVGCGTFFIPSKRKNRISLLFPGTGAQTPFFIEAESRIFQKKNPNAEIAVRNVNSPGGMLKACRELPGAKLLCVPNAGYLIELGLLAPLDEMQNFQDMMKEVNSQYIDWINLGTSKKHCYAIPFFLSSSMCSINKVHARTLGLDLKNAPRNIKELLFWLKAADKFNKKNGRTLIYGTHLTTDDIAPIRTPSISFYLTLSNGKPFIREEKGEIIFNYEHGEEWIELFREIKNACETFHAPMHPHPAVRGETLFNYDIGPWAVKELKDTNRMSENQIIPYPSTATDSPSYSTSSKIMLGIVNEPNNVSSQKMAWDFIRHLTCDSKAQERLVEKTGFIAINKSVFERQTREAELYPFIQALATGVMRNDHPAQHSIMKIVRKYFYDALSGKISPDDAVRRTEEVCRLQIEIEQERHQPYQTNN